MSRASASDGAPASLRDEARALDPATSDEAPLLEVFRSVQGEGLYLGRPQVFVRLRGCPLRCRYCDTPHSWSLRDGDRTVVATDAGERTEDGGIASPFRAACLVAEVEEGGPQLDVSLTGGEPLLWPRFVRAFAAMVRPRRLHLETAGAHPATLASLLGVVDHVSLDLKLPGDLAAPVDPLPADEEREGVPGDGAAWRAARRSCLDVLAGRDACAKLVLCDTSSEREAYEALDDLADLAPELPLFVQPATPFGRASAPSDVLVRSVWVYARELGLDPRVVPQVHRLLGVR